MDQLKEEIGSKSQSRPSVSQTLEDFRNVGVHLRDLPGREQNVEFSGTERLSNLAPSDRGEVLFPRMLAARESDQPYQ